MIVFRNSIFTLDSAGFIYKKVFSHRNMHSIIKALNETSSIRYFL